MFAKQVDPHFQFALIETNIPAIATQYTVPSFSPDPEADIVTNDGAAGSRGDDQCDRKLVCLSGIDCSNQEHRFSWKRNAYTFYSHKEKDRPVAIGRQEMLKIRDSYMEHLMFAFTIFTPPRTTQASPRDKKDDASVPTPHPRNP